MRWRLLLAVVALLGWWSTTPPGGAHDYPDARGCSRAALPAALGESGAESAESAGDISSGWARARTCSPFIRNPAPVLMKTTARSSRREPPFEPYTPVW